MNTLNHLRKSRTIYALADLGRCITTLDDYMKVLKIDDPMRETVDETINKISELYDSIKQRKEKNNV